MDALVTRFSSRLKADKLLGSVYLANILLSFHYYLLVYIGSSYLSQFFSTSQISVIYIIGSSIAVLTLVNVAKILKKIGNYRLIVYLIFAEIIASFGMAFSVSPTLIAFYFLIYLVTIPTISFGLDILLESVVEDEGTTGEIRTTFITLGNISLVICTLIVAAILSGTAYYRVFLLSILFLWPMYRLMKKKFKDYDDGKPAPMRVRQTIREYIQNKDLYNVFTTHLYLQIFYAYMVVYVPIYLSQTIGFSWTQIGLMFTIMLLPFVFVEVPVGWLADKELGEKEMMTAGLAIMGFFTLFISFIHGQNFWLWTFVLFCTRIGAAMTEATADSYFFKKVDRKNTDTIGMYRIGGPAAYIIAPVIATLSLSFLPLSDIFIPLAILMVWGCHYALALHDTK